MPPLQFNLDAVLSNAERMKAVGWLQEFRFESGQFYATATELGRQKCHTIHTNLNAPRTQTTSDTHTSIRNFGELLGELFGSAAISSKGLCGMRWIAKSVVENSADNRPRL